MSTNRHESSLNVFFALIRAGLWEETGANFSFDLLCEQSDQGRASDKVNWNEVYLLATEQSVIGVVLAGIEQSNVKPPQELLLQWIGEVQIIEQRNKAMNSFIEELISKMRAMNIYSILVKGQGLAQCYEKPLWRACGDIDLFYSKDEYPRAINYFLKHKQAKEVQNAHYTKSFGIVIDSWFIELHGTLRNGLSSKMDCEIDVVQRDVFYGGNVRSWMNGHTQVFLPSINNDVFFVFIHFIKHFYKEKLSLRQLCDWCRLLWTYRGKIDETLLKKRLIKAGLMTEWRAFAALVVEYLGMPEKAMPLYSSDKKWKKKAKKIVAFILKGGEWQKFNDTVAVGKIFPLNTFRFLPGILLSVNWLKIKERMLGRDGGRFLVTEEIK